MTEPDEFEINSLRYSDTARGSPKVIAGDTSPVRSVRPVMDPNTYNAMAQTSWFQEDSSDDEARPRLVKPSDLDMRGGQPWDPRAVSPIDLQGADFLATRPSPRSSSKDRDRTGYSDLRSLATNSIGSVTEITESQRLSATLHPPHRLRHKPRLAQPVSAPDTDDEQTPILSKERAEHVMNVHKMTLEALVCMEQPPSKPPTPVPTIPPSARLSQIQPDTKSPTSTKAIRNVSLALPPIDVQRSRLSSIIPAQRTPYPVARHRSSPNSISSPRSTTTLPTLAQRDVLLPLSLQPRNSSVRRRETTLALPPAQTGDYALLKGRSAAERESHFRALGYDDSSFAADLRAGLVRLLPRGYDFWGARVLGRVRVHGRRSSEADRGYGWLSSSAGEEAGAGQYPRIRSGFEEGRLLRLIARAKEGKGRYAWVGWGRAVAEGCAAQDIGAGGAAGGLRSALGSTVASPVASRQVSSAEIRRISNRLSASSPGLAVEKDAEGGLPLTPMSAASMAVNAGSSAEGPRGSEGEEDSEGLVFVLKWSVLRISIALGVIVFLAIAAALLWIFLGPRTGAVTMARPIVQRVVKRAVSGTLGAGDRLGAGVALGICVLVVGLTGFGGWLAISWLLV